MPEPSQTKMVEFRFEPDVPPYRWPLEGSQRGPGQAHAGICAGDCHSTRHRPKENKILHNLILCFNCLAVIYYRPYIFFPADTLLHVFLLSISILDRYVADIYCYCMYQYF